MHGVTRAVAALMCLLALAAILEAQPPVSPRNSYERILVILPIIGSGTPDDPQRPALIPAPGSATPNILNLPAAPPATGTGLSAVPVGAAPGGPSTPQNLILGYTWVPSDDGKFALTEIVMRDRSAFPSVAAAPGVPAAFIKGVHKAADILAAFQQYKKDFDPTKFGAWVR